MKQFSSDEVKNSSSATIRTSGDSDCDVRPVVASYIVTFLKPEMLHIYRQITALQRFRPVVFAQKKENADAFPFKDVVVLPKPLSHPLRRLWQKQILGRPITIYRSEARRILAALHEANAALLHVYFGHIGIHLLPLLEICDLPVVVSFHGADAAVNLQKSSYLVPLRQLFQRADLLLVRSISIGIRLRDLGCNPEKIRLHRTGIPLCASGSGVPEIPSDGRWRCLQACRLIEKKGLATSLRAFAAFARKYPRALFTIAGEGPQRPVLEALARELGIEKQVKFTGFISQEKLQALITESHLFIHPSEVGPDGDQEGVPNSMLEAMACGLPVLATSHGGIAEAVVQNKSGILVPERDTTALAQAMLTIAGDRDRYSSLSAAAAERVTAEFDLRTQSQHLETIYTEVVQNHSRSRSLQAQ